MTAPQDITALLGSRICHDLISPLGAISNGVELLEITGLEMGPELQLISQSVTNANARIRFFRIAFGAPSDQQLLGPNEVRGILHDLTQIGKLSIDWQLRQDMTRTQVRLAFLALMCIETATPWGGQITVNHDSGRWAICATSDRFKEVPQLWDLLSRDPTASEDVGAVDIHFLILSQLLSDARRPLTLDRSDGGMLAQF